MNVYRFSSGETDLFNEFTRLQYQCFVIEQGWNLPCNHLKKMTLKSKNDPLATYILIEVDGEFIGGGRFFKCSQDFIPHKNFYSNIFKVALLNENVEKIGIINGVCFRSLFRGERKHESMTKGDRRSRLLRRLTLELLQSMKVKDIEVALFSTGIKEVAYSCHKLGFKIVMKPIPFEGPVSNLISMATHVPSTLRETMEMYKESISDQAENKLRLALKQLANNLMNGESAELQFNQLDSLTEVTKL